MPPSAILCTRRNDPAYSRRCSESIMVTRFVLVSNSAADHRSAMIHGHKDITIIGGGPTGLFALFYAGMRGVSAQIVDALPDVGGQLTALYPEKFVFDVAGFPKI